MNISPLLAQKIVNSMKEIIQQDINFIDKAGTVIASTNPIRVGTFHDAGKKVVETGKTISITANNQHLYEGCQAGINLPVSYNNEIIASIGITGDVANVSVYGDIIRRMTEILILEEQIQQLHHHEEEQLRILTEDLLFYPQHIKETWDENTQQNWFDTSLKQTIIIKPFENPKYSLQNIKKDIIQLLSTAKPSVRSSILFTEREGSLIIIYKDSIQKIIDSYMHRFIHLSETKNEILCIAFGSPTTHNFKESYENALLALNTIYPKHQVDKTYIVHYADLTLDLLLPTQTQAQQQYFKEKILGALSEKDLNEFREILPLFEKHNGSITHIAEEMYIHKNTLQYKIQKLKHITGYDLRNFHDFVLLRLAASIDEKEQYTINHSK